MINFRIFLRTDQKNSSGQNTVYLRLRESRRKKDISLGIQVFEKNWNSRNNSVKKTDRDYLRKNKLIQKYISKAHAILDEHFFHDKDLSFDLFVKKLRNNNYNDGAFCDFVLEKLENRNMSHETYKAYKSQVSKLNQFRKKIAFSDLTPDFVHQYQKFLIQELKNNENTTHKSLRILKAFINWAIEDEHMEKNPFKNIKTKHINGNREYLSVLELEKLEKLYQSGSLKYNLQNVLRYFLFACYTGLRYTDLKELNFKNIKKRNAGRKEIEVIEITMHKTKMQVTIPLTEKAKAVLPKKYSKHQVVFKTLTNQKTNQNLKQIIKEANIDKNITFHSARHTLATTGLEMGIPIEVISKILGHTELKTTQIYAKVNDSLKYREMMKLDK
jgi:integrase/recombinase XerC